MPAFAPLATSNEKPSTLDTLTLALWATDEVSNDGAAATQRRPLQRRPRQRRPRQQCPRQHRICSRSFVSSIFNIKLAEYFKLLYVCLLAITHLLYMNDYIEKFAVVDELTTAIEVRVAPIEANNNDVQSVMYTMHAFIDYKKNLWMSVGAMCASLTTTACVLLLDVSFRGEQEKPPGRWTMATMRFVDVISFAFLISLLFDRITSATAICHMIQQALRSAQRLVGIDDVVNQLSCSLEPRESLPLCSTRIILSIFPVEIIEYLIFLGILTAAYIGLAYLIQWCIRHFFPPNHPNHPQCDAILVMPKENRLIVAAPEI